MPTMGLTLSVFNFKHPWRLHVGTSVGTAGILAHASAGAGVPGYMGVLNCGF